MGWTEGRAPPLRGQVDLAKPTDPVDLDAGVEQVHSRRQVSQASVPREAIECQRRESRVTMM